MTAALPLLAGALAAILQLAGALKTAPPLAGLPFDLTVAALGLLLPCIGLLLVTRRWRLDPVLAMPLAAAALLMFWLVVAGSWSPSREVVAAKLPDLVLVGPMMLGIGMVAGAEPTARRAMATTCLVIGLLLAATVAVGAMGGWTARLLASTEQTRLQYQLAGLALAIAASLAAIRAARTRHPVVALAWIGLVGVLAVAALLPGGRTALVALGLGVALAPALGLALEGRRGKAAAWLLACGSAGLAFALALLLRPEDAEGLRTLERLTTGAAGLEARKGLWVAALDWAGQAAPFGLGTGGFQIAAGHGERRGLYPHNHALEALAEGGLPGFLFWLGAFGGGLLAAAAMVWRGGGLVSPRRAAEIAAMVLPVALTVMVSTDLGNRMAWFALGLALSLGVGCGPVPRAATAVPRHV